MNKGLKNKGLGSWFCLAAALVALITGIVFLLTQATAAPLGHSGTMAGVVLLVGAAASLVFFFVSVPFSALIQAVIYIRLLNRVVLPQFGLPARAILIAIWLNPFLYFFRTHSTSIISASALRTLSS